MDADNSGELTLDEIDQEGSDLWMSFRMWCANHFTDSKDMVVKMAGIEMLPGRVVPADAKVTLELFKSYVKKAGWKGSWCGFCGLSSRL